MSVELVLTVESYDRVSLQEWTLECCILQECCSLQEWREEELVVAGLKPEGARGSPARYF